MLMLVQADARSLPFADECVQCCITSPPYFGLRDYGTARWEGGDPACDHKSGRFERGGLSSKQASNHGSGGDEATIKCPKCGATRLDSQIGLEPTIDAYVAQLVTVFREVWRVLKPNGVCWLNLGDSYAAAGGPEPPQSKWLVSGASDGQNGGSSRRVPAGLKPKDLCMIPARVALALQAEGWWLRSEICWSKPNPLPESCKDRPTKSHEMIYLLAKSSSYYFDADAVREQAIPQQRTGAIGYHTPKHIAHRAVSIATGGTAKGTLNGPSGDSRNIRSVWHIATQPYPGAHFATFPEKLVERCVLAGSRLGDVVLDPFMGSGTVARVALRLGRKAIGCDLNPEYLQLADDRTQVTYGLPLEDEGEVVA